ncbi:MAG: right-handed parallel beta-helix repeat-containing protein [bacterium]|nr:right-handed parallel beta-helix repeat-containing protein [bacterium]
MSKKLFILGLFLFVGLSIATSAMASGVTYYISPSGNDSADGLSEAASLKTIQKAVEAAAPGDTIKLAAGEYRQDIISRRDGTATAPIIITGPTAAIIKGGGNGRVIEINHDYLTLTGFTVDGFYGSSVKSSSYRNILVFVLGKEKRDGVTGFKALNLVLKNSGGECLRLRYFVTHAEVAYNTISNCGILDFVFKAGGKNGEGIYVGTSNRQWGDGKNPTSDPDVTRDNLIHHNDINTNGNECVDIKEGATANMVEYNTCRGQKDPDSGGLDARGSGNTFRYNTIRDSVGAGVRLGGALVKNVQYGKNNNVYNNVIENNKSGGIRFQVSPQGQICGNQFSGNTGDDAVGDYGSKFKPAAACPGSSTTGNVTLTPSTPAVNQSPSNPSNSAQTTASVTLANSVPASRSSLTPKFISCVFSRPLAISLMGEDIKCLQKFLNSVGFPVAAIGPGSRDNETPYFGPLTKRAVMAWQNSHALAILVPLGLTTGTGYWGPASMAYYLTAQSR